MGACVDDADADADDDGAIFLDLMAVKPLPTELQLRKHVAARDSFILLILILASVDC